MPLRPSQAESMSHSLFWAYCTSTQAVSRFVPEPLPHTSSVPVYAAPFWPPHFWPERAVSIIQYDVPEPEVPKVTEPL